MAGVKGRGGGADKDKNEGNGGGIKFAGICLCRLGRGRRPNRVSSTPDFAQRHQRKI